MPEPINRKPLVKKVDEEAPEEVMVEVTPVVEVAPPVAPIAPPTQVGPKKYVCVTRCWTKKQIWEPGDVTTFGPG